MAFKTFDYKGLQCPLPSLNMLSEMNKMSPGDIIEAVADCETFETDVRELCQSMKKTLIFFRKEAEQSCCQIRI